MELDEEALHNKILWNYSTLVYWNLDIQPKRVVYHKDFSFLEPLTMMSSYVKM